MYDKELNETYYNEFFIKINEDNNDLYKYLTKHTGSQINSLTAVESLFNTLEVEVNDHHHHRHHHLINEIIKFIYYYYY